MIEFEGLDCVFVEIITVETMKAGLLETFSESTCPAEKIE
jgi:hypothetical protein